MSIVPSRSNEPWPENRKIDGPTTAPKTTRRLTNKKRYLQKDEEHE